MTMKTYALLIKAKAIIEAENTLKRIAKEGEEYAEKHKSESKSNSR